MSVRSKNNLAGKSKVIVDSEEIHDKHALAAVDYGFMKVGKDLTQRQYDNLVATGGGVLVKNQALVAITDGAGRVGKPVGVYTSGMADSPMRAVSEASKQERNLRYVMDVALQIAKFWGYKTVYGYFLTITVPNVSIDEIVKAFKRLGKQGSAFVKALSDASRRDNGLTMTGRYGAAVKLLGSLLKMEITVNADCLKNHRSAGIFHHHLHILLLTDKPLNIQLTKLDLFRAWKKRNPDLKLSPKAFLLEPVYSHGETELGTGANLKSAMVEAAKYTVKPDFYKHFPAVATKFSARVFAALKKATRRVHVLRPHGLVSVAEGFIGWLNRQKGLHDAAMIGGFKSDNKLDEVHVPDIYTRLQTLRGGRVLDDRPLTDAELLGANRALLENAVLNTDIDAGPALINWPMSKKGRLYKYLVEHTDFLRTPEDLRRRFELWLQAREMQWEKAYAEYEAAQNGTDEDKKDKAEAKLERVTVQMDDLQRFYMVLPSDLSCVKGVDLHRLGRYRALFDKMKRLNCQIVWDGPIPRPVLDADPDKSEKIEAQLAKMYLSTSLQDIRYFTPAVCAEYVTWCKTGHIYTNSGDIKQYSMIANVNWDKVQEDADSLADKKQTEFKGVESYAVMFDEASVVAESESEEAGLDDIFAVTV